MNWLDFIILIPIIYGFIRGLIKGFIIETFSLAGVFIGIFIAKNQADIFSVLLTNWFDLSNNISYALSFVLVFAISVVLIHILALSLSKFLKLILLNWLNRLLGACFGLIKMLLIVSILINFIHFSKLEKLFIKKDAIESSLLYSPTKKIVSFLIPIFTE